MKTKIIYISGSEIFNIADIRGAFEEVRNALNLDKNTVLFGVPVDAEDAGFSAKTEEETTPVSSIISDKPVEEPVVETEIIETVTEIIPEPVAPVMEEEKIESVEVEAPIKKRGRPRKEEKIVVETNDEPVAETEEEVAVETEAQEEKVVPILSVLATNDADTIEEPEDTSTQDDDIEIIPEITEEAEPETEEISQTDIIDDDEAKLEKLLSVMTPLEEDILEEQPVADAIEEKHVEAPDDSFDATLEQLATEFIENQDKLAAETKSNTRSKIGKLRNILPFKQSKHKDQGLGDLFGWAGIAANDEDFSVPGFFTSAASKK